MTDKDLKEAMKKIKVAWKKRCQLKAKGIKLRNKGDRLRNKGNKIAYKADTIFEAAVYKIKKCGVNWYGETYCVLEDGTSLKDKGAK